VGDEKAREKAGNAVILWNPMESQKIFENFIESEDSQCKSI
jgi:hypothetical protein